jgi:hypothetical protein
MGARMGQQITCRFASRQYFYRRDELCKSPPEPRTYVGGVLIGVVASALCADSFEPQARRYIKSGRYPLVCLLYF